MEYNLINSYITVIISLSWQPCLIELTSLILYYKQNVISYIVAAIYSVNLYKSFVVFI